MILSSQQGNVILFGLLFAVLGLTFYECRELGFDRKVTIWWLLLVAMVHVPGYLALRLWAGWNSSA